MSETGDSRQPCPAAAALVLKEHWAAKVLDGSKTLELRSHSTARRGIIAIANRGRLLGHVELTDVVLLAKRNTVSSLLEDVPPLGLTKTTDMHHVHDLSILASYRQVYGWRFSQPVLYNPPKEYSHPRGAIQWVLLNQKRGSNQRVKPEVLKKPAAKRIAKKKASGQ